MSIPMPYKAAARRDASVALQSAAGRRISQPRLIGLVALADGSMLFALGLLTAHVMLGDLVTARVWMSFALAGAMIAVLQRHWSYSVQSLGNFVSQVGKVSVSLTVTFTGLMALAFVGDLNTGLPREWLIAWLATALLGLLTLRWITAHRIRQWEREGRLVRRAVIVGGGRHAEEVISALGKSPEPGIAVLGLFDDRSDGRSPGQLGNITKLGTFETLVDFCRREHIDLLIVTLPLAAEDRLLGLLKKLWVLPVDIRLAATSSKLRFRPRAYTYIGGLPFLSLFDKPLSDWNWFLKALEDRLLGALMLALLSPVMALVALAVRLDSRGPVLFKQKRYGFNNDLIEVYKFRSMYVDMADADAAKLVTKDDPRVTPVGRFIRKTSLDELPQLFNVLMGDLSLVGPRPHALQAKSEDRLYDDVVDGYFARHKIKPGITGWAQVNGWRGETDTREKIEQRVAHDIAYIDRWSLYFDLYIIAVTPLSLLKTENAY